MALPAFVPPMLAKLGAAFDSSEHLFEVKWDGTRALAFVEAGGYRVLNRHERVLSARYPELGFLAGLPAGLVLDGEIVVLRDGKPDFEGMLVREQARNARKIGELARALPATYVVFDLVYRAYGSLVARPLVERREALSEVVAACGEPRLVLSEGVVGAGRALFEETSRLELEGVVAKRLDSPYQAGQRSGLWTKFKRTQYVHCAILGYVPDGADDFKSLIVATNDDGVLRCVGRVGSGIDQRARRELKALLFARPASAPLVPCPFDGRWVEPGLYCTVKYVERTSSGMLRAPVWAGLLE